MESERQEKKSWRGKIGEEKVGAEEVERKHLYEHTAESKAERKRKRETEREEENTKRMALRGTGSGCTNKKESTKNHIRAEHNVSGADPLARDLEKRGERGRERERGSKSRVEGGRQTEEDSASWFATIGS